MDLLFDDYGFLVPFEVIETDLDTIEKSFVFNEHRRWLYERLLSLFEKLIKEEIEEQIALFWINGSFVTKKELPKDIDVVIFIHHDLFLKKLDRLRKLQSQFHGKIDFFFEPYYPENHRLHAVSLILKNDWENLFSRTRRQPETKEIHKKGFLQINLKSMF